MVSFLKELPEYPFEYFINKKSKATPENAPDMLKSAISLLEQISDWNVQTLHDRLMELAQQLEVKNGTLLWPVRIAAAGMQVTPGGAMEILAILGKEESLRRLRLGLEKITTGKEEKNV
jgi:glutamyl-tRNA synthetase